jgi:hypothetical protein
MIERRHPLHSICPYFAMFPAEFVERHVLAFSKLDEVVFDPFAGRGTTALQSLLLGRRSYGIGINPVAACIAGAKVRAPSLVRVLRRIDDLESSLSTCAYEESLTPFFFECFHPSTLSQIIHLKKSLAWRTDDIDRFVAAMTLGALHGESHRSTRYLSNRMPRTISTKPAYSMLWWRKNNYIAPNRNAFVVLRELARHRLHFDPPERQGDVLEGDVREAGTRFGSLRHQVNLVVTSPPYFDTTDYAEDQWLRLWFLGGDALPKTRLFPDDRHTQPAAYWEFLRAAWDGMARLLSEKAVVVVRIGGRLEKTEVLDGLNRSIVEGFSDRQVKLRGEAITTKVKGKQTSTFRPGARDSLEHDVIFDVT